MFATGALTTGLLAFLCCLAPPAAAVERSDDGFGQVLIFPYLSANGTLATLISISQRAQEHDIGTDVIAIRVTVHHAADAAPSASHFDVLLPYNAGWTFAVQGDEAGVRLHSNDRLCVFGGEDGDRVQMPYALPAAAREGWVEVYELGIVTDQSLESLVLHRACDEIADMRASLPAGSWLDAPANRLRGASHLVDGPTGTSYSLPPVALRDFRNAPFPATIGGAGPTLADAQPAQAVVRVDGGQRRVSTFEGRAIDAVSAVLMDAKWHIDFTVEPEVAARTDLVVLLPTRAWHVPRFMPPRAPFAELEGVSLAGRVNTTARIHARIAAPAFGAKCSPAPRVARSPGPVLDGPLAIVEFAAGGLLDSAFGQPQQHRGLHPATCVTGLAPLPERVHAGRYALEFDANRAGGGFARLVSDEGHVFHGLPAVGAAISRGINGDVDGVRANYGLVQPIARETRYAD